MQAAVKPSEMGNSTGLDTIPTELVKAEGEAMNHILTAICNKIWKTEPTTWTQFLDVKLPQKGNKLAWKFDRIAAVYIFWTFKGEVTCIFGLYVAISCKGTLPAKFDTALYCQNGFIHLRGCLFHLSGVQKGPRLSDWSALDGRDFP